MSCLFKMNMNIDANSIEEIGRILNQLLVMGCSPPTTSEDLMCLLGHYGSKQDLIQLFREGRVKWVRGMSEPMQDREYQAIMNTSMIRYLTS